MDRFQYTNADSAQEAVKLLEDDFAKTKLIAGGMDVVAELKEYIEKPEKLINVGDIEDLKYIKADGGKMTIGAATTIAEIAADKTIRAKNTALAEAAAVVGSPQIRNLGTLGGNLCQRPRCWYYRGEFYHCLKKKGSICYAMTGRNKYHAILGGGPCYIVHPSDCAPALVALGAQANILGPEGSRMVPVEDLLVLPSENILRENTLKANEIITDFEIPAHNMKSLYIKFREKEGFDWALSSVAAALELEGKNCKKASIVLGGVAPKPWRAKKAEDLLQGKTISDALAERAGKAAVEGAEPLSDNEYKIELTQTLVKRALQKLIA